MLLSVHNLEVSYGAIRALHGVSLEIDRGEIVALIGSNGAGKTTLLRTISGLIRPTGGSIRWNADTARDSVQLQNLPPHQIVRLGLSQVPEGRQVFPGMTVRENLLLGGYLRKRAPRGPSTPHASPVAARHTAPDPDVDVAQIFDHFPVLGERRHQKAGTLSGGEQQMLVIGRALMAKPRLLLLDEPSLGLAPLIVRRIFEIIGEINRGGTTIFLVEQNAHMALRVAHRAYVLQSGQVILADRAEKLLENPDVKKAYLGG
jgi:branched-chain amino acid transport system ATP-binding protein